MAKLGDGICVRNLRSLLAVFVEVAQGRNRRIPGASKSRTTLPPYYTCHEGERGGGGFYAICKIFVKIHVCLLIHFISFGLSWLKSSIILKPFIINYDHLPLEIFRKGFFQLIFCQLFWLKDNRVRFGRKREKMGGTMGERLQGLLKMDSRGLSQVQVLFLTSPTSNCPPCPSLVSSLISTFVNSDRSSSGHDVLL